MKILHTLFYFIFALIFITKYDSLALDKNIWMKSGSLGEGSIVVASDEKYYAVFGHYSNAKIFDFKTCNFIRTIKNVSSSGVSLHPPALMDFSLDSKYFIYMDNGSSSSNKACCIQNSLTGETVQKIYTTSSSNDSVFTPQTLRVIDSNHFIMVYSCKIQNNTQYRWKITKYNINTGLAVNDLYLKPEEIKFDDNSLDVFIDIVPKSNILATLSESGIINYYDLDKLSKLKMSISTKIFETNSKSVIKCLKVSPNLQYTILGVNNSEAKVVLHVYDNKTGKEINKYSDADYLIKTVNFGNSDEIIYYPVGDKCVKRNITKADEASFYNTDIDYLTQIYPLKNKLIAFSNTNGLANIIDENTNSITPLIWYDGLITNTKYSYDDKYIGLAIQSAYYSAAQIELIDKETGNKSNFQILESPYIWFDFSPKDTRMLYTGYDNALTIVNYLNQNDKVVFGKNDSPFCSGVFSADAKQIISCDKSGNIKIWDAESKKMIDSIPVSANLAYANFTSQPDKIFFVEVNKYNYTIGIYDRTAMKTTRSNKKVELQTYAQPAFAFINDQFIYNKGFISIDNLDLIYGFEDPQVNLSTVTTTSDGKYTIAGGDYNKIIKWDNKTRRIVSKFTPEDFSENTSGVFSLAVSHKNDSYISSYPYNFYMLWNLELPQPSYTEDRELSETNILYPNPANFYFYIDNSSKSLISKIQIIDVSGNTLIEQELNSEDEKPKIDISQFNSGAYFCRIFTNTGVKYQKLNISK
jgi:WD40 repeat protein